jgi:hypothetical protein
MHNQGDLVDVDKQRDEVSNFTLWHTPRVMNMCLAILPILKPVTQNKYSRL